ncbi:MAG: sulfatase [Verrucomicrobiota bacterium]
MSLLKIPALSLLVALVAATLAVGDEQPNILFISVDDLNDYISPLDNHPGVITPNFDRLAKRSVTFTNAHCAAPACHPSRVAVMTGVHPVTSGIYRNLFRAHGPRWRHESPQLKDAVVLSQHFRNHGYHAAGGGKIFHTLQWTPGDSQNDPDAWDEYRGDPLDPISADWPRPNFTKDQNDGFVGKRPLSNHHFGAAPLDVTDAEYGDHLVVNWAIEQMNTDHEKPVFLAVGLFRPHIPFEVSQKWFDLYPMEDVQLPEYREDDLDDAHAHDRVLWHKWVSDNDQWKTLMQGYLASISYVDNQLGRLLDALDASSMADNTIVVLWTDHGFHIGEKNNWEKFALWDQTTNTPLFISAPGISQDGEKSQQPATLTDLYPTLCELAGLPTPEQCTGTSLVPQLKHPTAKRKKLALTSHQFNNDTAPSHAVADSRYRLIRYPDGFEELYDLKKDPNEFTNRANDPELANVKARLAKSLPKNAAPNRTIPTDSPYHLGPPNKKKSK